MNNSMAIISLRRSAYIAGIGFLISFLGAIFTGVYVNALIIPGDALLTVQNIVNSELIFRAGILSWLLVIIGDILRAWALWVFFREINKSLALFAAWFMLVHDAIFGSALINLISVAELALSPDALPSQIMQLLNEFDIGFEIGLFFFSFHLMILGYMVLRSGFIPKVLGYLLLVAAVGYLGNSVLTVLFTKPPEIIWTIMMGPCLIGELALIVWLVIKGGKLQQN